MVTEFPIGKRHVGRGHPCFVIAEAGVNHNGDLSLARRLIDVAAEAGADAVKFQSFDAALLAVADAPKADYQRRNDGESRTQREMLEALQLAADDERSLAEYARNAGILFLSTPFDEASADRLDALGMPAFKFASGELTNHLLLAHVARKRKPMLISTGMSTLDEIDAAVAVARREGAPSVALLHCVSNYPAEPREANLRAIATLEQTFGVPTGWSDHTLGIEVSLAAVALGAAIVEKHFTLDRTLPGPDHAASLEPTELRAMVTGIRSVESALGTGVKTPSEAERAVARVARRSLRWRTALVAGHVVTVGDLIAMRPADGLSPMLVPQLVGCTLRDAVDAQALVRTEDLQERS